MIFGKTAFRFVAMSAVTFCVYVFSTHFHPLLLHPTASFIQKFFATEMVVDSGFVFPELMVVLNESCSGLSFFMLSIAFMSILFRHQRFLVFYFIPLWAFLFAVGINTLRIMVSIYVQVWGNGILPAGPHYRLHEWVGNAVFLSAIALFLAGFYLIKKYASLSMSQIKLR
ncbi:MAG: hypothetical protein JJU02_07690 [Cryomorphaceae bacterium]|nr:hypothetical protein [Cryomorphaceae bacterium]